ncbi:uncharacterized protein LOC129803472 isoform X2 [Phlebotomus papatasi]|uniref:uncharacterized protein LOC129803472 isoform X2 n=1 Tax=Phlebotomus papatasi TaxID=29031 RepID=UPI0024842FFF|nr:uncharacterized protein LOC129803472 isoform X2 [Phlebotomus papatasi]
MSTRDKDITAEFIKCYREHTSLWNNKKTLNKQLRQQAYAKLTKILKKCDPNANKDTVTKKINCLRTNFKSEYKKMQQQLATEGPEVAFASRSPHFQSLLFLAESDSLYKKGNKSKDDVQVQPIQIVSMSPIRDTSSSTFDEGGGNRYSDEIFDGMREEEVDMSGQTAKGRGSNDDSDSIFDYDRFQFDDDEYDAFGKYVAAQMKSMDERQRIYLKRVINKAIFSGEMKRLSEKTKLVG